MRVVDASAWVSLSLVRDANHQVTRQWFELDIASGSLFYAPSIFLVEIAAAFRRRTGSAETAAAAVTQIDRDNLFEIYEMDSVLIDRSVEVASGLGLRAADAVYVALAAMLGVPLITWDTEQLSRAGRIVDVTTPAEALASQQTD
ncbi:MAG: type II toxin-antitoxin system VapC family toxin [Thermomicrobiales bacterium]|nr:type II toxin-antitoxin system VapC family toxin [Thermomicrobiales bacterium]